MEHQCYVIAHNLNTALTPHTAAAIADERLRWLVTEVDVVIEVAAVSNTVVYSLEALVVRQGFHFYSGPANEVWAEAREEGQFAVIATNHNTKQTCCEV